MGSYMIFQVILISFWPLMWCWSSPFDQKPTIVCNIFLWFQSCYFFFASPIFNCRCRCVYIYLELITQGIFSGSCMWKLLKYISLFCWCSQSRRTMTRHLNQPSYDFSLCPKDRKNNTTQHDTINWMGIKSEKGISINFLKLFYGIDAQHDNWWWRFFCLCEFVIFHQIVLLFHIRKPMATFTLAL